MHDNVLNTCELLLRTLKKSRGTKDRGGGRGDRETEAGEDRSTSYGREEWDDE